MIHLCLKWNFTRIVTADSLYGKFWSSFGTKPKPTKMPVSNIKKILMHLRTLEPYGTRVGEPQLKHIGGSLRELRPLSHRIFFFYWRDNKLILLRHFINKTQKTRPTVT